MASPRKSAELRLRRLASADFVKRIARGDRSAFATLYDTTCELVYGLLFGFSALLRRLSKFCWRSIQEVWEQAATYDEREKPMTWLITMAHSRAIARLKADRCNQPRRASLELASRTLRSSLKKPRRGDDIRAWGIAPGQQ